MNRPRVSVVTPFRNVAPYLAQCIESVLAQTLVDFEYILSDNGSTDGSTGIAEDYAARDPRIRLVRQPQMLAQVPHYNAALREISPTTEYCKMVQADDAVFPECLARMVAAFEQSPRIGLVSSYYLKGNVLRGSGFPYGTTYLDGMEMARFYLRTGTYVFGSPSAVMYRSSLVRETPTFYEDGLLHEDTEKCVQILKNWDFGFVPQVLSYLRIDNESVSSRWRQYQPEALDWYIIVQRYASVFLDEPEASARRGLSKQEYYRVLGNEVLCARGKAFWQYHREGLKSLGESIDRVAVVRYATKDMLWLLINPGILFHRIRTILKHRPLGERKSGA